MHDDQLIGYLLRALEPAEMLEVERRLREEPSLRARLEQLEAMLEPLQWGDEPAEPPADLVGKTLAFVDQHRDDEAASEAAGSDLSPSTDSHRSANAPGLSSAGVSPTPSGTSWWDVVFTLSACAAMFALLFPALYESREEARTVACQENLRELGRSLAQFALNSPDRRIPGLGTTGREAFAGVYAVRLKGAGLLDDDRWVWCPSEGDVQSSSSSLVPSIPPPEQLAQADDHQLALWQQVAGGRYAYNLGVLEGDRYSAPRLASRPAFALMSDVVDANDRTPHPGVLNVLYEDGHVERRTPHFSTLFADHPWQNRAGRREAGLDVEDAVLAPSSAPPFVWVEQR